MIFDPAEEELLKKVNNRYQLVMLISKRVEQLNSGMPPQIETNSKHNATIAIRELATGKVKFRFKEDR